MPQTGFLALSPEWRLSTYYGLFFLAIGAFAPFTAVWFDSLGVSSTMSGVIFAMSSIMTVFFTIFIGGWADRLGDWRTAIIICNWIVLVVVCWVLFRQGPWDLLFVWTVAGLFSRVSGPIIDAAALNSSQKTGSDYARIRSFGSMGFIGGVVLAGWLFDVFGIEWFVAVLIFSASIRVIGAHQLPKFRSSIPMKRPGIRSLSDLVMLRHKGIFLVLIGAALINASHGFVNAFSVMHWTNVGISTGIASVLWSVSVFAEVALMWSFKSVASKVSARKCLLLASVAGVLRWAIAGTDPNLFMLFFVQALHSITFGLTFLATVNFIGRRVHEDHAAQAQSEYAMLITFFIAISTWSSGWLYEQFAGRTYWAMATLALLGGISVAMSFRTELDDPAASL